MSQHYGRTISYLGEVYQGGLKDSKCTGFGVFTALNGSTSLQRGFFRNLKPHGQIAHYCRDGSKYVGACKNGERHGWGVFTEPLYGRTYEGNYVRDMRHGLGCWTQNIPGKKRQVYDGMWRKDQHSG